MPRSSLRRPEIGHQFGGDNQLIVVADVVHGLEDVALDDAHIE